MKRKSFLTAALLCMAMSSSAQIQLLFFDGHRHIIDRTKKVYFMDEGEEDPCFDILNYKKTGNKETFTLKCKAEDQKGRYDAPSTYTATCTLSGDKPVHLTVTGKGKNGTEKFSGDVKTTSGSDYEDERLVRYFGERAGYPATSDDIPTTGGGGKKVPTSVSDVKEQGGKNAVGKAKDAAKGALGKVKGLFGKKKKD